MENEKFEINLILNIDNSELKSNEIELILNIQNKFKKELDSIGVDIEEFRMERR